MTPANQPVLIAGTWRSARAVGTYAACDPKTGVASNSIWPVSGWADLDEALNAATKASAELARLPAEAIAVFLDRYATRLKVRGHDLVAAAHAETALPMKPRLADVELPRMLDQLRQAAAAAREETWRMAMIDTSKNIRSAAFGLGPVVVFPPNNFPFAFGAVTGGDFAAAIAGGNPVIAKSHRGHPAVSLLAAEEAVQAIQEAGLPAATIQLVHGVADGERLVADPRVGATGFTGGEEAGRKLFTAAASAGRVMWVEMGAINPVVLLPGALTERTAEIADELTTSITGSAGQLCTKPGLVFFVGDAAGDAFVKATAKKFAAIAPQTLLSAAGRDTLAEAVAALTAAGGRVVTGGQPGRGPCDYQPTLLQVSAAELITRPDALFVEAFGNATMLVRCSSLAELRRALGCTKGSLGGSIYLARDGRDDPEFSGIARLLVEKSGRVIENRMPTGLAVTAPMQHGGPWPSAGPPFFSAVGMPWTILRFARRVCFDGWSESRLPDVLRTTPPPGRPWRFIDGGWIRG